MDHHVTRLAQPSTHAKQPFDFNKIIERRIIGYKQFECLNFQVIEHKNKVIVETFLN